VRLSFNCGAAIRLYRLLSNLALDVFQLIDELKPKEKGAGKKITTVVTQAIRRLG
jgi:hypothetical protein